MFTKNKIKTAIKGVLASVTSIFLILIFAASAQAATMTFHKFNTCYGNYGYIETWTYTDYSWGEEFWLGKKDHWTFIRTDRAYHLDGACRTWRA